MSNEPQDYAMEEFYDRISQELYPEHREQAIEEFTDQRLKSYYQQNPRVMRPAVEAIQEGKWQLEKERYSPTLVFYVSAIELLLKATLLRPVLYGLIHNEGLAEIMVTHILGKTGIQGYRKLLKQLFDNLTEIDLNEISREGAQKKLLEECQDLQTIRNDIIHKGAPCTKADAEAGSLVAEAVFNKIVKPLIFSIGLYVEDEGEIAEH
jgi:hypothetical protein